MSKELSDAVKELTQMINKIPQLKDYYNSNATSYEEQREKITELKQLNKKVKELL